MSHEIWFLDIWWLSTWSCSWRERCPLRWRHKKVYTAWRMGADKNAMHSPTGGLWVLPRAVPWYHLHLGVTKTSHVLLYQYDCSLFLDIRFVTIGVLKCLKLGLNLFFTTLALTAEGRQCSSRWFVCLPRDLEIPGLRPGAPAFLESGARKVFYETANHLFWKADLLTCF